MSRWTGSATDRVLACPASAALPAVLGETSDDANDGQVVHAFIYRALTSSRATALAEIEDPDIRLRCEAVDLRPVFELGEPVAAETAYAYDPITDTARILGTNIARDYAGLGPTEIPTTTDIELVDKSTGRRTALDVKSGWKRVLAEVSGQIRMHGVAIARARAESAINVGILTIAPDGKALRPDVVEMDDLDLAGFAVRLRNATLELAASRALVAAGQTPDVTIGDHCTYCPARSTSCPANAGIIRRVLDMPAPSDIGSQVELMTPEEKGEAWLWKERATAILKALKGALTTELANGPIPLPGGKEVALIHISFPKAHMVPDPTGATMTVAYDKPSVRKRKAS